MSKPQPKLLLFDVDGVILDSFEQIYTDLVHFLEQKGKDVVTQEQFREFFQGNALERVLEASGLDASKIDPDAMKGLFATYHKAEINEGMGELLTELAKKHVLVAITSTLASVVQDRFDALDLTKHFSAFLGAETGADKKHKVTMALEEFGSDTGEVIFISDTAGDLLEVKPTSVKRIGVTWGFHDRTNIDLGVPDEVAETPEELRGMLTG